MRYDLLTKKAIFKSSETNEFFNSRCVLTISVGQPNHEGDKLVATILALSKQFESCTIMVCDSLQKYTMGFLSSKSLDELHKTANDLGDEWINRNISAIKKMTIPYKISRWDDWVNHINFLDRKRLIDKLYSNDSFFKKNIDYTASSFIERKLDRVVISKEVAFNLSKAYLLEECAVMILLSEEGYQFEIYPSQRNDAMNYIYEHVISCVNRNLMRAVSIKFKNLSPVSLGEIECNWAIYHEKLMPR